MRRSLRRSGEDLDQSVPAFGKKHSAGARRHAGGEPASQPGTDAESDAVDAGLPFGLVVTGSRLVLL